MAHFGCRRAETIRNNWHKHVKPTLSTIWGSCILKNLVLGVLWFVYLLVFGIIGTKCVSNPCQSGLEARNCWKLGEEILPEGFVSTRSEKNSTDHQTKSNGDNSWPNSCLRRVFGGSRNRLNIVLAFGNLGHISGLALCSLVCKGFWGTVWGSEEIGEGELLNIEKYISSQDKEFHDEIWRPPFD